MVLFGVFVLLGLAPTAPGQAIVITARSVKALADDVEYVLKTKSLEARPTERAILNALEQVRSGALVQGVDLDRSIGAAGFSPPDFPQGGPPTTAIAVPVTNFGQFLDSLKKLGAEVDDQPGVAGFSHKVTGPNGSPTLFVLESRGYALFSPFPSGVEKLKTLDPMSWQRQVRPQANLSVKFQVSDFPRALTDQIREQLRAQAERNQARRPGEDDARLKGRIAGEKLAGDAINQFFQEADALSMDVEVDRKASQVVLETTLTARPGTAMATSMRNLVAKRSRFARLSPDATLAAWTRAPLARQLQDLMSLAVESGLESGLKKADTPEAKKMVTRLAELSKANLGAPEIDLGLALRPAASPKPGDFPFVLDLAMSLTDARAVEQLVRDLVRQSPPDDDTKVAFDVAKAADGTTIHQMTRTPRDGDPGGAKRFGNASLAFAFRDNAALASFGVSSPPLLRRLIDGLSTSRAPAPGSEAPIGATARVGTLGGLMDREDDRKAFQRAAADSLQGEDAKRDRMSLRLNGEGDGVRLRLAADVPAIRLLILLSEAREAGN